MFSPMGPSQPCEIHNSSLREDDIWLPPLSTVTLCLWSFCFFRRASGSAFEVFNLLFHRLRSPFNHPPTTSLSLSLYRSVSLYFLFFYLLLLSSGNPTISHTIKRNLLMQGARSLACGKRWHFGILPL